MSEAGTGVRCGSGGRGGGGEAVGPNPAGGRVRGPEIGALLRRWLRGRRRWRSFQGFGPWERFWRGERGTAAGNRRGHEGKRKR